MRDSEEMCHLKVRSQGLDPQQVHRIKYARKNPCGPSVDLIPVNVA